MRRISIILGSLAAVFGVYWMALDRTIQGQVPEVIDGMRQDGWSIDYASLDHGGFPTSFSTAFTDLEIMPTDGSWTWILPEFEARANSLPPNSVDIIFPSMQSIRQLGQAFTIEAEDLIATASVGLATNLPLDGATLTTGPLQVQSTAGWTALMGEGAAAFRAVPNGENSYLATLDLRRIAPPPPLVAGLVGPGGLPETISSITAEVNVVYDRPIDRSLADGPPLRPMAVTISDLSLEWGEFEADVVGDLTADDTGTANGTMTVTLTNWEMMVDLAAVAGLIPNDVAETYKGMGATLSNGNVLNAPITVTDGAARIGFIPLGEVRLFSP